MRNGQSSVQVSKLEKVIWFDNARSITLGAQIQDIVGTNADLLQNFVKKYDFQHDGKYLLAATDSRIFVVLRQDVQPEDILVAYLQAAYAKYVEGFSLGLLVFLVQAPQKNTTISNK